MRLKVNVWLCPVKPKSWHAIKKFRVFGAPYSASKIMSQVKFGDLLVFHVLKPVSGIVSVGKVVSEVYEDNTSIWGKNRYPLRVKIEFISDFQREESPIPVCVLFGCRADSELSIEPHFYNVWIAPLSESQFENLKNQYRR